MEGAGRSRISDAGREVHNGRCQKVNDRRCREGGTGRKVLHGRKKYGGRCHEGGAGWELPFGGGGGRGPME